MVVINFQDQLQPGTFEHAIYTLVENNLDLSVYFPGYKNEDTGRPAYDPAILLTCDDQEFLGHELFAIDGCKMP